MKVNKVTITGADDKTDLAELWALHLHYPFVEWGILFSKNREATQRYPSRTKILEIASYNMPLSAHFCGWHSKEIMNFQNFRLIDELPESFKRVQINYNFWKSDGWQVKWIIDYAHDHPERAIIFQQNASNAPAMELIRANLRSENIHFLYDSSGGRGVSIDYLQIPYNNYTGYSGGIHPENVDDIMSAVYNHKLKDTVWIDMESGVRTENDFDPDKVSNVLSICNNYIQTSPTFSNDKK